MSKTLRHLAQAALAASMLALAGSGWAQVIIDQNRALAGNVTPGDTPGFPVTITQPGHYVLKSNLTVPAGNFTGVKIAAPNVTLDLNGFSIIGSGGNCYYDPGSGSWVVCSGVASLGVDGPRDHEPHAGATPTIRGGTVQGFSIGVRLISGVVESMTLRENGTGVSCVTPPATSSNAAPCLLNKLYVTLNNVGLSIDSGMVQNSVIARNHGGIVGTDTERVMLLDSMVIANRNAGSRVAYRSVRSTGNFTPLSQSVAF